MNRVRAFSLSLVLVVLALAPASALADAPRIGGGGTTATPPPPPPPGWQAIYQAGSAAYDAGRLDEALADFRAAFDRGGPSSLLYDIALTLDRLQRTEEAVAAYHRYLDAEPEASNRDVVEARLTELERPRSSLASRVGPPPAPILSLMTPDTATGAATTAPAPSSASPYVASGGARGDHIEQRGPEWVASWVMLGLTALSVGATLIVWYDGLGRFNALYDQCASAIGCTTAQINASAAHDEQDATNALIGVSAGLGALTIATFILEGVVTGNRTRVVRADAGAGPRLAVSPFGISLSGSF